MAAGVLAIAYTFHAGLRAGGRELHSHNCLGNLTQHFASYLLVQYLTISSLLAERKAGQCSF